MKLQIASAALIFAAVPPLPLFAQTTGVSKPDQAPITVDAPAKPSAAIPMVPAAPASKSTPAPSNDSYGPYIPYRGANASPVAESSLSTDPDAQIVTSVPDPAGEIREGTIIKARIQQGLSTLSTIPGTHFSATLSENISKDGRVILPAGSILNGDVTEVHSGRRITGAAAMHLQPRSITLPDGSKYTIHAQLIDLTDNSHSRVDNEGTVIRRDHPKEVMAAMGVATGGAAAAGTLAAGPVGTVVGAGIGAGASTVVWLKQDRQETLPKDSELVFSLTRALPLKPSSPTTISSLQTANPTMTAQ